MSRLPIVTTGRHKTALRNAFSTHGNAGGFESADFETAENSPTPDEIRQLEAIAVELTKEEDGDVLATRPNATSRSQSDEDASAPTTSWPKPLWKKKSGRRSSGSRNVG